MSIFTRVFPILILKGYFDTFLVSLLLKRIFFGLFRRAFFLRINPFAERVRVSFFYEKRLKLAKINQKLNIKAWFHEKRLILGTISDSLG